MAMVYGYYPITILYIDTIYILADLSGMLILHFVAFFPLYSIFKPTDIKQLAQKMTS